MQTQHVAKQPGFVARESALGDKGEWLVSKTLAPFCTCAMSGLAGTEQTLRELCPRSRVLPGLAVQGGGRGQNTLVTRIAPDAAGRAQEWGRRSLVDAARR
ncbi:MAG TPA: hypothetical protein PLO41_08640 [Rubrivivax sp.]|nr:hypothetical protein [Rubrivivax sp.]